MRVAKADLVPTEANLGEAYPNGKASATRSARRGGSRMPVQAHGSGIVVEFP